VQKYLEYFLLVVLIAFVGFKGVRPGWTVVNSDFANYYVAAQLVVQGKPLDKLYDNDWFQEQIKDNGISTPGKFAPFPPITAWMMVPLTPASPLHAQRILMVVDLLFLGLAIWLMQIMFSFHWRTALILILGAGQGFSNNLAFGQVYWIIATSILLAIYLEQKGYARIGGALLAIGAAIKYIPVVFIFSFLFLAFKRPKSGTPITKTSAFQTALAGLFTITALVIAQYAFFGSDIMQTYFSEAFLPHLDGTLRGQGEYSLPFQSWDGLLRHWFVGDRVFNPTPLFPWPEGRIIGKLILLGGITASLLYSLFRLRNSPHFYTAALTLPLLGAMVLLPATTTYHFILLLTPIALLINQSEWIGRYWCAVILALYFVIGFLPLSFFFEASSSWGIWFAYPRVWLTTSLYVLVIVRLHQIPSRP
jgi:hypothetical protein